jgi:hypothetical protein
VRTLRVTALLAALVVLSACGREPSASQLTATGIANLQNGKTAHLDGAGSIALKAQSGLSFSFDFKLSGDAEMPNKARMNVQLALLGMSFNVDTITVDGKEYTKGVLDPLGNVDMSFIHDVVEVDRPEVDGRRTRHLRYQADTTKMVAAPAADRGNVVATDRESRRHGRAVDPHRRLADRPTAREGVA